VKGRSGFGYDGTGPPRVPTTADLTRAYIDAHPSIRESLRENLVNSALLARRILTECDLTNSEAVEMACRRYHQGLQIDLPSEREVRRVLAGSRLQVRSRVALVRIREDQRILDRLYELGRGLLPNLRRPGMFQMYQGTRALTVLCEDDLLATLLEQLPESSVLGVERNLASVALESGTEVAETPGVVAGLAEALYHRGINCLETVSVHTESIFVFREEDVIPGYTALAALLGTPGPAGGMAPVPEATPRPTRRRSSSRTARGRAPPTRPGH
jgi:hypothetical protein